MPEVPTVTITFDPVFGVSYQYQHCQATLAEMLLLTTLADVQRRLLCERLQEQRSHGVVLARPMGRPT